MPRLLLLMLIGPCVAASAGTFNYFVYWVARPELMTTATHVTPQVWVESDSWAKQAYPRYPLSLWQEQGVMPLRSLPGMTAKHANAEKYAADWTGVARRGYPGIAIDEFGSADPAVNRAMAEALRLTRRDLPGTFIAVWHAGPLTRLLADTYRDTVDLVLIETYARSIADFAEQAKFKLSQARYFGIAEKCAFALGVNDTRPGAGGGDIWAQDIGTVHSQLEWIRRYASGTAGVGFFAIYASEALQADIDRSVRELFRQGDDQ